MYFPYTVKSLIEFFILIVLLFGNFLELNVTSESYLTDTT